MTVSISIIQRALKAGNPVIDGERAVFIWEGRSAIQLMSDLGDWGENPKTFKRVTPRPGSASAKMTWSCALTLPRDAYLEYYFHDPKTQTRFLDPLNRRSVNNGMGGRNNFFYMPESMPAPFTFRRADVPPGALTIHRVETGYLREDGEREIFLYRPPVKEPVPLLIVYDGQDYLRRGKLPTIVDNLIAQGRIQPIAMAFLSNGGRWRAVEYLCSDAMLHWVEQIVLPLARENLNLLDVRKHPGAYGVLGASAGGTMSMYTGFRLPEVFGKVICQSGVFSLDGRDFAVVDLAKHGHARDFNIWMDVGTLDSLLEDNRRMKALLEENGYNMAYREFSGGHNYTAWRDDVWRGLEFLFPSR